MSIPLDANDQIFQDPAAARRLRQQYGGTSEVDADGSAYGSVGDRPVPPPKAMRLIHANRQAEIRQREEDEEADATMREYDMGVKEDKLYMNSGEGKSAEAMRQRRTLAQRNLDARLCDTAYEYDVSGCALSECNGCYAYSTASCHGAPVYQNERGWTLHRDRPPVESTIGTDEQVSELGWLISKEGRPFYAVKTEGLVVPLGGWQCFLGPQPAPTCVTHVSWDEHFLERCGPLKDEGNAALKDGRLDRAEETYTEAIEHMDGFDDVISSSDQLRLLHIALHANRAEVWLRRSSWQAALEDCRFVLGLDAAHAKAAARLCRACRALGRSGEALEPCRLALASAGNRGEPTLREMLDETEVLAGCESGASRLSEVFGQIGSVKRSLAEWTARGRSDSGDLQEVTVQLSAALSRLGQTSADAQLARELTLLLQGTSLIEAVLSIAGMVVDLEDSEWTITLACVCVLPAIGEGVVRRIVEGLPEIVPQLVANPRQSLELVRTLLRHPSRQRLKISDSVVATRGLLASCLRPWVALLESAGTDGGEVSDGAEAASEVIQALGAQTLRLDNLEALALALFVETFIGQKLHREDGTQVVSGGFVLYHGPAVRQVVLALFRNWAEDDRILQSFSPELVGRIWLSMTTKLRRDAGVEVEKQIPGPSGKKPLKLEWFKLRRAQVLRKGAFHPEEILQALLEFLRAHLRATCARGCEEVPQEGLAPRHPAEEWLQEAIDRPFGWGVLLPLLVAPPPLSCGTLALLEEVIDCYPHQEKLAKKLAGLHAFMPLLGLPWPTGPQPASSHMQATLALSSGARGAAAKLLACAIDTEIGLRVAEDNVGCCVESACDLLANLLKSTDRPDAVTAAIECLGILTSNLECWELVPQEVITAIVAALARSSCAPTRAQLSKLLRHAHRDRTAGPRVEAALKDEAVGLDEEQHDALLREIFDVRTLAGQAKAEMLLKMRERQEQIPAPVPERSAKGGRQVYALCEAIHRIYLQHLPSPRVLILGRLARAFCSSLARAHPGCRIVLAETTLEKLAVEELGPSCEAMLLPPIPQALAEEPRLSEGGPFDLLLIGEPLGYCAVAEYAEQLRPFLRRRACDEEKKKDQVQCLCVEIQERLEAARDELFSAGYYDADHDGGLAELRPLARALEHGVALFALPSEEREQKKRLEGERAVERKVRRRQEAEVQASQAEEEEQRRSVLFGTLFDPLRAMGEVDPLSISADVGAAPGEEELLLVWLPGNSETPGSSRDLLAALCTEAGIGTGCEGCPGGPRLRAVEVALPEEQSHWHRWTDEQAVSYGAQWFEMAGGVTQEDEDKAAKDPATNISFTKPNLEVLQGLEGLEVSCRRLLRLLEELVAGLRPSARLALGGFAQGGAAALYAALGGLASAEVRSRLCGVVLCCSGVPALHFLGPRLQDACLRSRQVADSGGGEQARPVSVHMIYGRDDTEVKDNFVQTSHDLLKRFHLPVPLYRFRGGTSEDRFPEDVRGAVLTKVVRALLS